MADQNQIIDGSAIGDNQPHRLESDAAQIGKIVFEIFHGEIFVDAVLFEKSVEFVSGLEIKEKEEFRIGDMAVFVFFQCQPFESAARQITTGRDEPGGNVVRNVNSHLHSASLFLQAYWM